jgi:hypothetical protein
VPRLHGPSGARRRRLLALILALAFAGGGPVRVLARCQHCPCCGVLAMLAHRQGPRTAACRAQKHRERNDLIGLDVTADGFSVSISLLRNSGHKNEQPEFATC